MLICGACGEELILTGTDSRQTWTNEYYACSNCGREYMRTITFNYKGLVESDELENVE